jgi:hypothetical protein
MTQDTKTVDVYLEIGKKRTIAGAIDWPGWCRIGRDEDTALQALAEYGPRYARALARSRLGFKAPDDTAALKVVDRLDGNTTTDFGAPDIAPPADAQPVDEDELGRLQSILRACWRALDAAAEEAKGKELRKGPRGGGRDLDKIVEHVLGSEAGYLARLAWKPQKSEADDAKERIERHRQDVLDALAAAARGETPKQGPRGGAIWTPRYFVRRDAWHILDHAWEIEDRS